METPDDETPDDDVPSGLPPDNPEAPPLGVPERPEDEGDERPTMPGIPTEDDPPTTG